MTLGQSLDKANPNSIVQQVRNQYAYLGFVDTGESFTLRVISSSEREDAAKDAEIQRLMQTCIRSGAAGRYVRVTESEDADGAVLHTPQYGLVAPALGKVCLEPVVATGADDLSANDLCLAVQFAVAIVLAEAGRVQQSVGLLDDLFGADTGISDMAAQLLSHPSMPAIYSSANRMTDAIELGHRLLRSGYIMPAVLLSLAGVQGGQSSLRVHERVRELLKQAVDQAQESSASAAAHYTLGNHLDHFGFPREAVREYIAASRANPDYKSRVYWWEELGSCLWNSGKPLWAEAAYRRAIDCKRGGKLRPRTYGFLGDILLRQGRFGEALENLAVYLKRTKKSRQQEAWFVLRHWFVSLAITICGDHVNRDPLLAHGKMRDSEKERDPIKRRAIIIEALQADPLNEIAWMFFADSLVSDRLAESGKAWLAAAVIHESNAEAWAQAIVLFMIDPGFADDKNAEENDLLPFVIFEAHRLHGACLLSKIREILAEVAPGADADQLLGCIDEMARELAPIIGPDTNTIIRLINDKGQIESIID